MLKYFNFLLFNPYYLLHSVELCKSFQLIQNHMFQQANYSEKEKSNCLSLIRLRDGRMGAALSCRLQKPTPAAFQLNREFVENSTMENCGVFSVPFFHTVKLIFECLNKLRAQTEENKPSSKQQWINVKENQV